MHLHILWTFVPFVKAITQDRRYRMSDHKAPTPACLGHCYIHTLPCETHSLLVHVVSVVLLTVLYKPNCALCTIVHRCANLGEVHNKSAHPSTLTINYTLILEQREFHKWVVSFQKESNPNCLSQPLPYVHCRDFVSSHWWQCIFHIHRWPVGCSQ